MARDEDAAAEAREDRADMRADLRGQQCRCGPDMAGSCPNPANCPMCQPDAEEDAP